MTIALVIVGAVYTVGLFFSIGNWVLDHTFGGKSPFEYLSNYGNYRGYTFYTLKFFAYTVFWPLYWLFKFINGFMKGI